MPPIRPGIPSITTAAPAWTQDEIWMAGYVPSAASRNGKQHEFRPNRAAPLPEPERLPEGADVRLLALLDPLSHGREAHVPAGRRLVQRLRPEGDLPARQDRQEVSLMRQPSVTPSQLREWMQRNGRKD